MAVALHLLENSSENLFITGRAGTGKSTLLRRWSAATTKQIVLLAPTGLAAINIGGQTIHSFFRLQPRLLNVDEVQKTTSPSRKKLFESLEALVIDEVSMVDANMLDVVDRLMRLNGRDPSLPFGGTRVVLFGDPFQLPPVVATREAQQFFAANYRSRFFFDSHAFSEGTFRTVELTRQFRQLETSWLSILDAVRTGSPTAHHWDHLVDLYKPSFTPPANESWLTLTTTNARASEINEEELSRLAGENFLFEAHFEGRMPSGDANLPADPVLRLRVGAKVMFIKNDVKKRWMNGTFGEVTALGTERIDVTLLSSSGAGSYQLERETWENHAYRFDPRTNRIESRVVGSLSQFPIRPAWAITIHKSQGQTLDRVILDFQEGIFEHGQAYVALSRCRTKNGVVLARPMRREDLVRTDPRVREFMARLTSEATSGSHPYLRSHDT